MSADHPAEVLVDRLGRLFATDVPAPVLAALDQRMEAAISKALLRRSGRPPGRWQLRRRRLTVAVAIVALVASVAATPAVRQFFDGWGHEFDQVFALSTPIDQSVTDDGYRVTVVRAYADASSLRLAMVAEDLEDRGWAEVVVGSPSVTDADGRAYAMSMGQYDAPTRTSSEGWLRFIVPTEAADPGIRHLTLAVDGLSVRPEPAPTLPNGELDLDNIWTSVAGTWSFAFDLEFLPKHTVTPDVVATSGEVTVTWDELTVTPAATVGRLTFAGLRRVEWGWDPTFRIEHDGREIDLGMTSPGSVQSLDPDALQNSLVFEAEPGFEDLSGTWTITIDDFHRDIPDPEGNVTTQQESIVGPWVLTFEGPPANDR